jgi:cellulose synthase/poly-beta-1,6-N-acetylglucosamine synthase-like glycosyltransferase
MSHPETVISVVAVISGLGIAYTYAGYPLLLGILSAFRNRKVDKAPWKGSVSIVLVTRNCAGTISSRIENLLAQKGEWNSLEIVVALDGSDDGTADAVRKISSPGVRLLEYPKHRGKAAALNDAVAGCSGEVIIFADSRQRFDESTAAELCANFNDKEVGAVSGELLIEASETSATAGQARSGLSTYWSVEKWIRKAESRTGSVIGCTGAVYAVRKECWTPLHPDTVLDDVAVPMNVILSGRRVVFDSAARAWDREEETAAREPARKIRTLAGNIQLCALYPRILCPIRNPALFRFFSHKLMRLFAPWLLALFLASTIYLSSIIIFASLLALLQLIFYSFAVAGTALGAPRLAILKLPSTFLLLNVWSAIAPFHYWSGRLSPKWR